jgi:flagellar hook assembly protein FlgD
VTRTSSHVEFDLPHTEFVTLKIYNILGEEVITLVSKKLTAGKHKYEWDASNLASGVYLYRLQAGDPSQSAGQSYVETRKMVLMR